MSWQASSAVLKSSEAVGTSRFVLLVLANYADNYGLCWPRIEQLAEDCRIDERTIRRHLRELAEEGHLWSFRRHRRSNVYVLRLDGLDAFDDEHFERLRELHVSEEKVLEFIRADCPDRNPSLFGHATGESIRATVPALNTKENQEKVLNGSIDPLQPSKGRVRPKDEIWDALIEALGYSGPLTEAERGRLNNAVKQLRSIEATPTEIKRRAQAFRRIRPDLPLTATALAANWNLVVADPGTPRYRSYDG